MPFFIMRILVLGASGMLGHKILSMPNPDFEIHGTCRTEASCGALTPFFPHKCLIPNVRAENFDNVTDAIEKFSPDAVVNCIGIVKQLDAAKSPIPSIRINSLFPHLLAEVCERKGIRMIHFSTDCVFSGKKGNYAQDAISDAEDLYGRTKYLGEVAGDGILTLRSSIIGRELGTKHGLVEWLISNRGGKVKGYKNAIYSGFTTVEMAKIVKMCLTDKAELSGVWQVASEPISKYDLLHLINDKMGLNIMIEEDDRVGINRSLDGGRFSEKTGYQPPGWQMMVDNMASDSELYEKLERNVRT